MTSRPWEPERTIDARTAAALIDVQFRALRPARLRPIGDGWDNTAFRVNDWGDVHRGDPALDLALAIAFLPAAARDAFVDAYGAIADDTWTLARFRAATHSVTFIEYGHDIGDADLVHEALGALRRVLAFRA